MEEQPNKPQKGFWESEDDYQIRPSIRFEIGKPVEVVMQCDKPREIEWNKAVFYVFDILYKGEELQITTSSWTLLRGLKQHKPLEGKHLKIVKVMDGGKQSFEVSEITQDGKKE